MRASKCTSVLRRPRAPQAEERLVRKADEYLAAAVPGWQSMSQEDIHDLLGILGATDDRTRQHALDNWNRAAERLLGPALCAL